jgi:hypothetical protein
VLAALLVPTLVARLTAATALPVVAAAAPVSL